MKLTINHKKICSFLLVAFVISPDIGSYFRIANVTTGVFFILALVYLLMSRNNDDVKWHFNIILKLSVLYIIVSALSTYLNLSVNSGFSSIFVDILFLFIAYVFTTLGDKKFFIIYLRNLMIFLSIVSLIDIIGGIEVWSFLKRGTIFTTDLQGGISSIFEFRHYYGVFLIFGLIATIFYPLKNTVVNFFIKLIFLSNIVLTYTRNIWIATIVVLILWMLKYFKIKLTIKKVITIGVMATIIMLIIIIFGKLLLPYYDQIMVRLNQISENKNSYGGIGGVRGYTWIYGPRYILQYWRKYLLVGGGSGFAIHWLQMYPYGRWHEWTNAIDVQYVSTFMNSGLIGLASLIAIILTNLIIFFTKKSKETSVFSLSFTGLCIAFAFFDVISIAISVFALMNVYLCYLDEETVLKYKSKIN